MRVILLIMIGASFALASDMVTDSKTGLVWQDNSEAKSTKRDWQGAQSYCNELTLGGYDDWRLPTIKELQSIVDVSRHNTAIKRSFKNVSTSGYYWSSSVYVSATKNAWSVYFETGNTDDGNKADELYVRCVRGRQ